MDNPNPERDEMLRKIRDTLTTMTRMDRSEASATDGYASIYINHVTYLLSLLDSQAAGDGHTCAKCGRSIAYAQYGPPINDAHWYHVDTERRTCDSASSVEELIAAEDSGRFAVPATNDAATCMRDRCVEKVKSLADAYKRKSDEQFKQEHWTSHEHFLSEYNAACEIITALQSLTLEQGEQEKSK